MLYRKCNDGSCVLNKSEKIFITSDTLWVVKNKLFENFNSLLLFIVYFNELKGLYIQLRAFPKFSHLKVQEQGKFAL